VNDGIAVGVAWLAGLTDHCAPLVGADAAGRDGAGAVAAVAGIALIFCPQEHDTLFPA